uniref:Uncharacterized protein n=1 Tax=Ditylenchus dipsaci TaxID=166011 RepID=A0A915D6C9_9BILA
MEHAEFDVVYIARCRFYIVDKRLGKLVEVDDTGWNCIGRCKTLFSKINSYGGGMLAFSHWMNEDMIFNTSRIAAQFQVKYLATDEEEHLRQTVGVHFAADNGLRGFTQNFNEGVNAEKKIRR